MWTGNKKLDKLRNKAANSSTGCIGVSIEELNEILPINTHAPGSSLRTTYITCLCGAPVCVTVNGNNNADGKQKCNCGRNITLHFRRHV